MNSSLLLLATVLVAAMTLLPAKSQTPSSTEDAIPLVVLDNVPLTDVIRNLARQGEMNIILDPYLSGESVGPDGKRFQQPLITERMEKVTPRRALEAVLQQQGLVLIDNPATKVARITTAQRAVKPVPANRIFGGTNNAAAIIRMDDVPLSTAISQLARQAGFTVQLDPKVSGAATNPGAGMALEPGVSFRWERLSAAQALAALLDAYDLEMTRDTEGESFRVSPKTKPAVKPASPVGPKPSGKAK